MTWRVLLLGTMSLCACADEVSWESCPPTFAPGESGCAFDETRVAAWITQFRAKGFVHINDEPFVQQLGPANMVDIWVSQIEFETSAGDRATAAEIYAAIDPEDPSSTIASPLPMGTMLIHATSTEPHPIMVKREAGFAPDQNDWWFGLYHEDGTPGTQGYGMPCMSCHTWDARLNGTDLLWGVPRSALP